jgi:hypothetical protein
MVYNPDGLKFGLAYVSKKNILPGVVNIPIVKEKPKLYIGFKKDDEMKLGISVTNALIISAIALLGITAWQYFK